MTWTLTYATVALILGGALFSAGMILLLMAIKRARQDNQLLENAKKQLSDALKARHEALSIVTSRMDKGPQ